MRLTRHNGRTGKNGVFNPKHNDRRFDVGNSEHIDEDRARQNLYWDCHNGFSSAGKKFDSGKESYSFEQIERAFYFNNYSDFVWGQNERNEKARHSERNRTIDDLLKSKKTCPEEIIYQIGTIEESVSWETLTKIAVEFFAELDQKYGSHVHILDWALHVDEGTPHIHERHVFDCKNRYGELCPQQEKALEELGIPLPDPDKKPGKNNNRKQTFDAECRKMLFAICEKYQLSLQEETSYGGRGYLEKQDYIIAKQKEVLAETNTALEAVTMKLADMETLVDEVAEQAYDKACSVVADTVREETKRADIEEVVRYREWLADPERKVEPKIREYALRHFNKLIKKLSAGVKNLAEKIAKRLQEPVKRAENMEQVKATAKKSLLAQMEEHKKKVEKYKAQYCGTNVQQTRKEGRILNNLRKDGIDMMDREANNGVAGILAGHIIGENGIGYTLGADGLYYPDLCLPEQTNYGIGKYGRMRETFLKEYRQSLYRELLLNGRLNEHLHDIEEECYRMMDLLVERMKKGQGVTEQLKAEDQMLWVQKVNNIQDCAEKVILREVIFV